MKEAKQINIMIKIARIAAWISVLCISALLIYIGINKMDWQPILFVLIILLIMLNYKKIEYFKTPIIEARIRNTLNEAEEILSILRNLVDVTTRINLDIYSHKGLYGPHEKASDLYNLVNHMDKLRSLANLKNSTSKSSDYIKIKNLVLVRTILVELESIIYSENASIDDKKEIAKKIRKEIMSYFSIEKANTATAKTGMISICNKYNSLLPETTNILIKYIEIMI